MVKTNYVKTKVCTKCPENGDQPIENFRIQKTRYKDKIYICYKSQCKSCNTKCFFEWKEKNKEKYKEYKRLYAKKNYNKEKKKAYYETNKAIILEKAKKSYKEYYQKNKDYILKKNKKWKKANKEKVNQLADNARKRSIVNVSNRYIKDCIVGKTKLSRKIIPEDIINEYREYVQIKRRLKSL